MRSQQERMARVVDSNLATFGQPVILHIGGIDIPTTGIYSAGYGDSRVGGQGSRNGMSLQPETPTLQLRTSEIDQHGVESGTEVTLQETRYRLANTPRPDGTGLSEMAIRTAE